MSIFLSSSPSRRRRLLLFSLSSKSLSSLSSPSSIPVSITPYNRNRQYQYRFISAFRHAHHSLQPLLCRSVTNAMKTTENCATWPTQSVGPDCSPPRPITQPHLRLIPGAPRFQRYALEWLNPGIRPRGPVTLSANEGGREASIDLGIADDGNNITKSFVKRFDFTLSSSSSYVKFSVKLTSESQVFCHGVLLINDIPLDTGTIHCVLYHPNGMSCKPIAKLHLTYLYTSPSNPFSSSESHHLNDTDVEKKTFAPRFTGHRGMGSSGPHAPWRPLENSLDSFAAAACTPDTRVRSVELDVQLSADGEVVVFHDWFFRPRDEVGNAVYDRDSVRIPIHRLSLEQFDKLYRQSYEHVSIQSRKNDDNDQMEQEQGKNTLSDQDRRVRALTLKEVCQILPPSVGILVELKYPAPDVQQAMGLPFCTRDKLVNCVLDVLHASETVAPQRDIAFLCFEPDVCDMLALKQNKYAVYLSHCETMDKPCDELDPRTNSLKTGLEYVKNYRLDGLMLLNKLVTERPEVIADIVAQKYPIITYGKWNSNAEFVRHQFEAGVAGVIADDIHKMLRGLN